jgi:hypothetical protein
MRTSESVGPNVVVDIRQGRAFLSPFEALDVRISQYVDERSDSKF